MEAPGSRLQLCSTLSYTGALGHSAARHATTAVLSMLSMHGAPAVLNMLQQVHHVCEAAFIALCPTCRGRPCKLQAWCVAPATSSKCSIQCCQYIVQRKP